MRDTSLRSLCLGLHNMTVRKVRPPQFRRYEYMLYLMAQLTRLVHEDTGFSWKVMMKALGKSNDVVNAMLDKYDTEQDHVRKTRSSYGDGYGRPMKSFTTRIRPVSDRGCWGTYISTRDDMTALVLNAGKMPIAANRNSILRPTDIIVCFKSTSTVANVKTNLLSLVSHIDLQKAIEPTNIQLKSKTPITVPGSFIDAILGGWPALMKAIHMHGKQPHRLFITGHSLGGALATLFGFIMAEAKIPGIKSIHIVAFGAPKTMDKAGCMEFNKHLDSGYMTYDRVITQTNPTPTSKAHAIFLKNDYIPAFPMGFEHPGYNPTDDSTKITHPYSMDLVRTIYGIPTDTRFREKKTWPFKEPMDLFAKKDELKEAVKDSMVGGSCSKDSLVKAKGHMPNFLSISPVPNRIFVHGETLGMVNQAGHRFYGIKNPVRPESDLVAYFSLCPTGVRIQYLTPEGNMICKKNPSVNTTRRRIKVEAKASQT